MSLAQAIAIRRVPRFSLVDKYLGQCNPLSRAVSCTQCGCVNVQGSTITALCPRYCTMHYIVSLEAASFGTIGLRYPFMICLLRDIASQVTTFNSRTAVQRRNCLERLRVRHRSATNCPTELSRLLFLNRSYVRVVTFVSFTFGKVYYDYDARTDDNRLI